MLSRIVAVSVCVAQLVQAIPMPNMHEPVTLAQGLEGQYGTWSIIKAKRGAMEDINKIKDAVFQRIKTEQGTAVKNIREAEKICIAFITNTTTAEAYRKGYIPRSDELIALMDAGLPESSDTVLMEGWDLIGSKKMSLELLLKAKQDAIQSYRRLAMSATTNIRKARADAVHYLLKLARDDDEDAVDDEMVAMMAESVGFNQDDESVKADDANAMDLKQAAAQLDLIQPQDDEAVADEPWTVRKARKNTLADIKKLKTTTMQILMTEKNQALAQINKTFKESAKKVKDVIASVA